MASDLDTKYGQWSMLRNDTAASELLAAAAPVIDSSLRAYGGREGDSLRTQAKIMAMRAFKTYDPSKGAQLNTYLMQSLKSLNREAKKRSGVIKLPEKVMIDQNALNTAQSSFTAEHGREPSVGELADRTGLSHKRIERIRSLGREVPEASLVSEEGDSLFSRKSDPQKIWFDYVYKDLDPISQKICDWSTGYGGTETLQKQEIARRLGMTPAAVSQRINKIVAQLQEGEQYG